MAVQLVTSYPLVKSKGTVTALVVPNVVCLEGDSIVYIVGYDTNGGIAEPGPSWGAASLGVLADGIGNFSHVTIGTAHQVAAGTHDLTYAFDDIVIGVLGVQVWRDFATVSPNDAALVTSGSDAAPISGPTSALAQAEEVQIFALMTEGPVGDAAGSFGNSITADKRDGTTGGVASSNRTLATGYLLLHSTDPVTASAADITARGWVAAQGTIKAVVNAAGALNHHRLRLGMGLGL